MIQLNYTTKDKSAQQGGFFIAKKLTYRASIAGFHNPIKHKDLTPEEFLQLYIKRLRSQSKKKDGWMRTRLADWIENHYADQIIFVSKLFHLTLKVTKPAGILNMTKRKVNKLDDRISRNSNTESSSDV